MDRDRFSRGSFQSKERDISKDKIKIARVISYLNVGGVEKRLLYVLEELKRNSLYDPLVICIHSKGKLAKTFEEKGIPVFEIRFRSRFDPKAIFLMVRLIKKLNIKIIHTHMYRPGISATVAAKIAGVKVIGNIHNIDHWDNRRQRLMDRVFNAFRDHTIAVSRFVAKDYIKKTSFIPHKISVIYNGIEPQEFRKEFNKNLIIFTTICRLVPQKAVENVLNVFSIVQNFYENIKLKIVGNGPERKKLENIASNIPRVEFLGTRMDIPDILAKSDILFLLSEKEGFSNVILEAMASFCPVFVRNVGGNKEAVENKKTGVVSDEMGEIENLCLNLLGLPKIKRIWGINSRKRVKTNFTLKLMTEKTLNLYESLWN